jgi:hypothetical protein
MGSHMSSSATGPSTSAPVRSASVAGYVMTARVTLALVVVQFGLAGLGAYSGLGGRDVQGSWWQPHIVLGYAIGLLTLVLLGLALVLGLGPSVVRFTAITAALAVIGQPLLGELGDEASAWFGLLHAINGGAIAAVLGVASAQAARGAGTEARGAGTGGRGTGTGGRGAGTEARGAGTGGRGAGEGQPQPGERG